MLNVSFEQKNIGFQFCHVELSEREKEVLAYCLDKPIHLNISLNNTFGSIQPKKIEDVGITKGLIGQLEAKGLLKCHYLDDRFERANIFSITEKGIYFAELFKLKVKDCA